VEGCGLDTSGSGQEPVVGFSVLVSYFVNAMEQRSS
jgi:hypothetical protein